jgi:MFS family permease
VKTSESKARSATLFVALVTNFVNPFAGTALNVAVPAIGAEFHSPAATLTWVVSSYMLCSVSLAVPFGRLADVRGKRRMLIYGILIFGVTSALCALCTAIWPGMPAFIVFRTLMGVGAAMIFATNTAILIEVFPQDMRGKVLGLAVAAVYIGLSLGPVIGGVVTHALGWRAVMYLIAAVSFIAFAIAAWRLPKDAAPEGTAGPMAGGGAEGRRLSPLSIALYVAAMILFIYGFTTLTQNLASYITLAAAIAIFLVYVRHEAKTPAPIVKVRIFHNNAPFLYANLAALFNYAATFAVGYLMSIYLQLVKGFPADVTGLILIFQPILQAAVSPFAGRLSDRKSPFAIASFGMACCAAALCLFIFVKTDSPLWFVVAGTLVVGFGFGVFSSPNTNVIMSSVQPRDFGIASSIQSTSRSLGQVIGMAIITIVTSLIVGDAELEAVPADIITYTMRVSFVVFAALCFVGIFFSLKRVGGKDDII